MAVLDPLLAVLTVTDRHVELRDDWRRLGQVDLGLLLKALDLHLATAIRAVMRKRCLELSIDRAEGRHATACDQPLLLNCTTSRSVRHSTKAHAAWHCTTPRGAPWCGAGMLAREAGPCRVGATVAGAGQATAH